MFEIQSFDKFPIRFKPEPDEVFSSWLSRLAISHGLNGNTLASLLWSDKRLGDKGIDADRQSDKRIFETLAIKTGIDEETIGSTSMISFSGYLVEKIPDLGPVSWIMPWQVTSTLKRYSMQFCPDCLREDKSPYFRKQWRLSFVTTCIKHKVYIRDSCPHCLEPIIYYRAGSKLPDNQVLPLYVCKNCKLDLRKGRSIDGKKRPNDSEIIFQQNLEDALRKGWVDLKGDIIYSHLYFTGIHFLMRHLSGKVGQKLCKSICEEYSLKELPFFDYSEGKLLETRSLEERCRLNNLTAPILADWSDGFVRLCLNQKIWSKSLLLGSLSNSEIPYWYWKVLNEHLSRPKYYFSEQEIVSIHKYVETNSLRNKSNITDLVGGPVYRQLLKRNLTGFKSIGDRKCIRCGATEKQRRSSSRGKRPDGNYRFHCGICNRTYTPVPLVSRLTYPQAVKDRALEMKEEGLSIGKISRTLSINRLTVEKWIEASKQSLCLTHKGSNCCSL
jgi:transposase-like protein